MKIIEKFIIKSAKRIKEREDSEKKIEEDRIKVLRTSWIETSEECRSVLLEYAEGIEKEMKASGCHLKIGDSTVLNKYELERKCYNNWDSGPHAIRSFLPHAWINPVISEVKNITVSWGNLNAAIDSMLASNIQSTQHLRTLIDNKELVNYFKNYLDVHSILWQKNFGLYYEIDYKLTDFDITPKFGLNSDSFLNVESHAGKFTIDLWNKEAKYEKISSDLAAFELEKEKLLIDYKRIQL